MHFEPLPVTGAFAITPRQFGDDRGSFAEWYRHDLLAEHVGHRLDLRQANVSVSSAGTLRGIHVTQVSPGEGLLGQAKYVTCAAGSVIDYLVDVRVGSPTFGATAVVQLDAVARTAVYVPEGVGHGFFAVTEGATVMYLCSSTYNPGADRELNPLDPELGLPVPIADPLLSPKDAAAPTLAQAVAQGWLPSYAACLDVAAQARTREG